MKCHVCGGDALLLDYTLTAPGVPQGRIHTGDVKVNVFVGCGQCSETLGIADLHDLIHRHPPPAWIAEVLKTPPKGSAA